MRKVYLLSLFICFIALSCKTKPANRETTFFKFLKGRSISGPVEFWYMNIKGKNLYFFSDAHEEETGSCPNCPGPMCDRIEITLDKYFRKQDSASHFFIESNFQIKGTDANKSAAINPAFLSKTIEHFKDFLEIGTTGKPTNTPFPNTHFHYADIRNTTPIISEISNLRDIQYSIKNSGFPSRIDLVKFSYFADLIQKHFYDENSVKNFLDLFIYSKSFKKDYESKNLKLPEVLSETTTSYLAQYTGGPHKVKKQLNKLSEENKESLKQYYDEEFKKINKLFNSSYQKTFNTFQQEMQSGESLITSKAFEKIYMTFFEYNYLLSNIYLLGRAMKRLEDESDDKDLIFYWGAAHSQHILQFLSRHYKTPIKPVNLERRDFRCIKIH